MRHLKKIRETDVGPIKLKMRHLKKIHETGFPADWRTKVLLCTKKALGLGSVCASSVDDG